MSLRRICRKILLDEIFKFLKQDKEWKVLIVDAMALRVISSCCTTVEILKENIALIELAEGKRSPLKHLEAIYILDSTSQSISLLKADFIVEEPYYSCAHVFFLTGLSDEVFATIWTSKVAPFIKTLKEINMSFLPTEAQVFAINNTDTFHKNFGNPGVQEIEKYVDILAEKIATLCCTLEEYPNIRYCRKNANNLLLADRLQKRLQAYSESFPEIQQGEDNASQLIILDRSFDCTSPLLHELTLQALVHDIMDIDDNIYSYTSKDNQEKIDINLDENDNFWKQHRHEHLARLPEVMYDIMASYAEHTDELSAKDNIERLSKDVSAIVKLRLKKQHVGFRHLIAECLERYSTTLKPLCALEQDLATGITAEGQKVKDPLATVKEIISQKMFTDNEKIRIIILYVFFQNGVSEHKLDTLLEQANIPMYRAFAMKKLSRLGCPIISKADATSRPLVERKDRSKSIIFTASRWTPVLKDVIESLISNELDETDFPCLPNTSESPFFSSNTSWCREETFEDRARIIIFIVGGVTYSELRCAYEITKAQASWEIIIGSDRIITPDMFLDELQQLCRPSILS